MKKFIIGLLTLTILTSNYSFASNISANFQSNANLTPTCSIKASSNNIVINNFSTTQLRQGRLRGNSGTTIGFICTKNTTVSINLIPNTPYTDGDDPYNQLISTGYSPKGALVGVNSNSKLAYALFISSISTSSTTNPSINLPIDVDNASYTTIESGQKVFFNIHTRINTLQLVTPDTYQDIVTINISY